MRRRTRRGRDSEGVEVMWSVVRGGDVPIRPSPLWEGLEKVAIPSPQKFLATRTSSVAATKY